MVCFIPPLHAERCNGTCREPDSPYLRIEVEAEVPGANTVQRAEADAMVADLQDAMTDAIEAAAEEVPPHL